MAETRTVNELRRLFDAWYATDSVVEERLDGLRESLPHHATAVEAEVEEIAFLAFVNGPGEYVR